MVGLNYLVIFEGKVKCFCDVGYYLWMIIYCLVVGGIGFMDDYLIVGLDEINCIFEFFFFWYVEVLKYIKVNYGFSGDVVIEVNSYIDYVINVLIWLVDVVF